MFAGTVPILIAPDVAVPKVLCVLPFVKLQAFKILRMGKFAGNALKLLTQELVAVSLILFVAVKVREAFDSCDVAGLVGNRHLRKL
jgi:hypothetical protein